MSEKIAPVKPKKRINSKGKGNGFENLVAKKLTAALQPLNFMRTPGSGARVGGKNFAGLGQLLGEDALKIFVGDVVPVNERAAGLKFHWSIETKFYSTQDNFTSLASGSANTFKWFTEAVVDAAKVERRPMLIMKWNHTDIFVVIEQPQTSSWSKSRLFTLTTYPSETERRQLDIYTLDSLLQDPAFWFSPA